MRAIGGMGMKRLVIGLAGAAALAIAASHVTAQEGGSASTVSADEWPYYGRDEKEQRFSPLDQINRATVAKLGLAWSAELDSDRGQEATPIMVDGVIYVSTAWSLVYAFDAATGKQLWSYDPQVPRESLASACCDAVNRGVAVHGGKVFVGTLDGRLVAVDAKTGKLAWQVDTLAGQPKTMRYTITGAVRAVKDKVVIGNSGAEFGVRGFVTAYDAATGKLAWRFYLTPNPQGKPDGAASDEVLLARAQSTWGDGEWRNSGGGGTAWDALTYDPDADLLYIGAGNGGPFDYQVRSGGKGDNLFLSSIVAVDPDTGRYAWHYQTTPSDSWDYTATQQIMGARLVIGGKPRDVVMQAPKNGYFYVLDRKTGELLSARPFAPVTWSTGIDMTTGRPILAKNVHYQDGPSIQQPGPFGAHSWQAMSYSPRTGLVYIPVQLTPGEYEKLPAFQHRPIGQNAGIAMKEFPEDQLDAIRKAMTGQLLAWDPVAQAARWSVPKRYFVNGGTLATAGDLVFQGDMEGMLAAYDAASGAKLWSFDAGTAIIAPPISYRIKGQQYVAVLSGFGGAGALVGRVVPDNPRRNGRLLVFKLGGTAKLTREPPAPRAPIDVTGLTSTGDPDAGMAEYDRTCTVCHGGNASVAYTADLRRSGALADPALWKAIVIDGALKDMGMVSFAQILTPQRAEDIRAYVLRQARKGQAAGK
ncbi:Pyrrolo-quinoline quinone [Rhizorhabdus wittichii RW1]|uniref:Pyrrolo-quinoline quinone n=1 Tax=Rhizorhabdus wittichii (strain DSM 6014 / CCUG 31198 / JCM 15750 / NBRC 105917 / EY 4224 / RW1) TaxID=392499 RepID=A0A9J9LD57_RHIWR|nr:Pyrrolo-quinoline quinone [Rhizorhabdus wittichii RW1]